VSSTQQPLSQSVPEEQVAVHRAVPLKVSQRALGLSQQSVSDTHAVPSVEQLPPDPELAGFDEVVELDELAGLPPVDPATHAPPTQIASPMQSPFVVHVTPFPVVVPAPDPPPPADPHAAPRPIRVKLPVTTTTENIVEPCLMDFLSLWASAPLARLRVCVAALALVVGAAFVP
jgi:hypothetical protein